MKLIVGLGNPGAEYEQSRHNVGFMVLDAFARNRKMTFTKEYESLVAKRSRFQLVKPQTYMNLSGTALTRENHDLAELLVVCDDIYLPFGEIRLRQAGQDGGHNGLASIIEELGSADFARLRIGVGQPVNPGQLKQYVLENFSVEELSFLDKTTAFAAKLIDCFIVAGFQAMCNHYSKNKKSYSESLISESKSEGGK